MNWEKCYVNEIETEVVDLNEFSMLKSYAHQKLFIRTRYNRGNQMLKNKILILIAAIGILISQAFVTNTYATDSTSESTENVSITSKIIPLQNVLGEKEGRVVLPHVIGMQDLNLQKKVNQNIEKAARNYFYIESNDNSFECEVVYFNGNLLVFSMHAGMSFDGKNVLQEQKAFHVNLITGEVYNGTGEIGSGISNLITHPEQLLKIIKDNPQKYPVKENTNGSLPSSIEDFEQKWTSEIYDGINDEGIQVEYLADRRSFQMTQDFLQLMLFGQTVYSIPYTDIENIIDKDGSLWKAFTIQKPYIEDKFLENEIELSSEIFSSYLKLDWSQSKKYKDCKNFRIYKSTDPLAFPSEPVADNITGFSYIDYSPTNSTCYYYVAPIVEDANPLISNIQPVEYDKIVLKFEVGYNLMTVNNLNERIIDLPVTDSSNETKPLIIDNRVMVPARAIIEILGGSADWNSKEEKITIGLNDKKIEMWVGEKEYKCNGSVKNMDTGAMIVNGRTMVPIRFVAESLGCDVDWLDNLNKVIITYYLTNRVRS